jgi:ferredoxin
MTKIILDQKKCIGCGACAALDPKNFKMTEDNSKAFLIDGKKDSNDVCEKDIDEITNDCQDAVDSCPVVCIGIKKN